MSVDEYFPAFWGTLRSPYLGYKRSKFLFRCDQEWELAGPQNSRCTTCFSYSSPNINFKILNQRKPLSKGGFIKISSGSPSKRQMFRFLDVLHTPTVLPLTLPFHLPNFTLSSNILAEGRAGA